MNHRTLRRILHARITHLSLVDRGANQVETLYKAEDDGTFKIETLLGKSSEEGLLTTLVYLPEKADFHNHVADEDVVKDMCHHFFAEGGGNIDVMHTLQDLEGGAHVAESFIVQKGDARFEGLKDYDGNDVNPEGSWGVIIKLEDPRLRQLYRDGHFNGVSMFGKGTLTPTEEVTKKFQDALADRLGSTPTGVVEMNEEQMQKLLDNALKPISERLEKLEKPEAEPVKKTEEPVVDKIEFEGDPTDAEALAKHEDKIMQASCDFSTPEGLKKWREYLDAKETNEPEEKSEDLVKAEAAVAAAEKKVANLRKASGQEDGDVEKGSTPDEVLQKGMNRGQEIAAAHNKRLGRE